MKIRKSRLKEIIKEEVNSFKFIPINEGHGGKSLRAADETETQLLSRMANTLLAMADAADDEAASGDRIPHSSTGPLADIVGTLQQLIDDDTMAEDFYSDSTEEETAEGQPQALAATPSESNRLLDEIIVQEIIKALAEKGGDLKGDEDEEEKEGGTIDPQTDTTERDYEPQFEDKEKIDAPKGIANKEYAKSIAAFRKKMHAEDPKLKDRVMEDDDWMGDVKSTGEWTDYTVAELEKKKAALMKKEKRTADEVKTVRQLNFAIRAKKGELSEEERA